MAADSLEIVVVGAGVIGASVSLRLALAGRRVCLVAPLAQPGSATTAAGAMLGVLGESVPDETHAARLDAELRIRAHEAWPSWWEQLAELADEVPALRRGTFLIADARRPADTAALRAAETLAQVHHLPVERVAVADVPGLEPSPGDGPVSALYLPDECWIDPRLLLDTLLAAGRRTGRVRNVHASVAEVLTADGAVAGVRLDDGQEHKADEVVVCAGAATTSLLGEELRIRAGSPRILAAKGVAVSLRPPDALGEASAFSVPVRTPNREFSCGLHVIPRGDGVYLGATNRITRWEGLTGAASAGEIAQLVLDASRELSRRLQRWDVSQLHWGRRPLASDGLPVVGPVERTPGLHLATGAYRNGVLLSPMIAAMVEKGLLNVVDARLAPGPGRLVPRQPWELLADGLAQFESGLRHKDVVPMFPDPDRLARVLAMVAFEDSAEAARLRGHVESILTDFPIVEMVPEALIEAAHPELLDSGHGPNRG
jgi:glycine oxidase